MRFVIALAALSLITAQPCHADGDGDTRAPNAAEAAFYKKVLSTFEKALPPAPAGWNADKRPDTKVPKQVYAGAKHHSVRYAGEWKDGGKKTAADKKASQDFNKMMAAQTGGDMEGRMREQQKLFEEMGKAAQSGNQAEMKRIQDRLAELNKPMSGAQPGKEPLKDACLKLEAAVNTSAFSVKKGKAITVPGAPAGIQFYRAEDGDPHKKDCPDGATYAVLGAWKPADKGGNDYTYFRDKMDKALPAAAAQNLFVSVRATEPRALEFMKKTDWAAISALLAR
jgi:hypothetical protein